MTSINYSAAASSAVRVLQSVNRDLTQTQNRISTGYKVNSAADNASVWKAASGLRSDIKSYEAASSSMDFGKGVYEAAAASADAVVDILSEMKTFLSTNASSDGTNVAVNAQLSAMQARLKAVINDAAVGGVNLLKGDTMPAVISAFSSNGTLTAATAITTKDFLGTGVTGFTGEQNAAFGTTASLLDTTITKILTATDKISGAVSQLTTVISNVADYSASLSGAAKSIQSSQDLMSKLADIKKTALGNMIDADYEAESSKLAALQVKQQLATQALSIANQSAQNVLRLFQ
ncbi:flagellin [Aureimonas sp. AU4]|uniref:flagellin N-terminal helical domain-containing protein n=1 Tax=Aureimonas sp. AU4 TaxID=1638163 RepID=UPI000781874A|nr:flagellin [Aureimonas sp. AU4]